MEAELKKYKFYSAYVMIVLLVIMGVAIANIFLKSSELRYILMGLILVELFLTIPMMIIRNKELEKDNKLIMQLLELNNELISLLNETESNLKELRGSLDDLEDSIKLEKFGFRKDFDFENRFDLKTKVGKYQVSTVDLGIDHSFGSGKPLYFETMIFAEKGKNDFEDYQKRYETKEEATKGHEIAVQMVKQSLKNKKEIRTKNKEKRN